MQRIELTPALWDEVAASDGSATAFHTRAWAESAVESFGHTSIETRAYRLNDAAVAVLPLLARRFGPFGELQCAPDATLGGPIAQRTLSDAEVAAMIEDVPVPKLWQFVVNGNPFASWRLKPASGRLESVVTQVVDVRHGDGTPLSRMRPNTRNHVRKAERAGLDVVLAETDADLDEYMRCYRETLARWGLKTKHWVSRARFEAVRRRMGESFSLWLVRLDGRVLGGDCVLYHNERAFFWHGATSDEGLRFNAATFLQLWIMEDACRRGCSDVDLGTSVGLPGLERFKASLGGRSRPFDQVVPAKSATFATAFRLRGEIRRRIGR